MASDSPSSLTRCALCISLALTCLPVAALAGGAGPARATSPTAAEVLTLDEAARFLRLKPQVVAQLARTDLLPGRHVAGQWRFHRAALVDWLKGDRFAGAGTPAVAGPVPQPSAAVPGATSGARAAPAAAQLRDTRADAAAHIDDIRATGGPATTQAAVPPQPASAAAAEPIGERPNAPTAEQTALRDQGVLLPAGRSTVEAGFSYTRAERQNFGLLRMEQNTASASATLRHGLREGLQISARLPATYRSVSTNVVPALGESVHTSDTYAGDLSASLLGVVAREGVGRPNVIVSADAVLPTGPGDRGLGAGIVVSKSYDPVVLFGGASYMRGLQDQRADPRRALGGHNFAFNFGYAYALNDSVALSGAFLGTYKTDPRGQVTGGLMPSRQTYQLQLGATLQLGRGLFVEPTVGVGVGGAAPDVTLSVSVPYTF